MAALLLALAQDGKFQIHSDPTRLMREINGLIRDLLHKHGKEEFAGIIELTLPATERNHKKFRKAIIETLQHLREMNIRSAINSSDDALGKFYETFLKYANGAKEMGIVLTPRHITRFAADVVGIGPNDVVFDPACGTGGFLISALETIKADGYSDHKKFASESLYGVEQRDDVYGLAIVNMIFRGDGKSHIYDGDCFDYAFWKRDREMSYSINEEPPEGANAPFTRVLMNPPFKQPTSEPEFVNYGLKHMVKDGIMFALLPYICIEPNKYQTWRKQLLKRHTLRAVIKFDKNLFYPVQEATYALILQAHEPHDAKNEVFIGCLFDDNHRPRKSKMLSNHEVSDNLEKLTKDVRRFLLGQSVDSINREQTIITIDPEDHCNFAPEAYLTTGECPIASVDIGFRAIETKTAKLRVEAKDEQRIFPEKIDTKVFPVSDFIESEEASQLKALKDYPQGNVPVVTAQWNQNGIARWLDVPDNYCFENRITISIIHNTKPCQAFWHPYRFAALGSSVMILRPKQELLDNPDAIFYLCEAITKYNSWRYHYARTVKFHELMVEVPTQEDNPDIKKMAEIVKSQT